MPSASICCSPPDIEPAAACGALPAPETAVDFADEVHDRTAGRRFAGSAPPSSSETRCGPAARRRCRAERSPAHCPARIQLAEADSTVPAPARCAPMIAAQQRRLAGAVMAEHADGDAGSARSEMSCIAVSAPYRAVTFWIPQHRLRSRNRVRSAADRRSRSATVPRASTLPANMKTPSSHRSRMKATLCSTTQIATPRGGDLANDALHGLVGLALDTCHGLVEQQAARVVHQGPCDPDQLLLAEGQVGHSLVGDRLQPGIRQHLQRPVPVLPLGPRKRARSEKNAVSLSPR